MSFNDALRFTSTVATMAGKAVGDIAKEQIAPAVGHAVNETLKAASSVGQKFARPTAVKIEQTTLRDEASFAPTNQSDDIPPQTFKSTEESATKPESLQVNYPQWNADTQARLLLQHQRSNPQLLSMSTSYMIPPHITSAILDSTASLLKFWKERISPTFQTASRWVHNNPFEAALIASGVVVIIFPGLIMTPAFMAAGFGGQGVVLGGIAAGAQSIIGDVVAGSLFATLTSAAMGGYGVPIVAGAVQIGSAVVVSAAALSSWLKAKALVVDSAKED